MAAINFEHPNTYIDKMRLKLMLRILQNPFTRKIVEYQITYNKDKWSFVNNIKQILKFNANTIEELKKKS